MSTISENLRGAAKKALIVALLAGAGMASAQNAAPSLEGVWLAQGDGLLRPVDGKAPPLKPAAARAYQAVRAKYLAGDAKVDPAKRCKPPGEPRLMIDPAVPFEIVTTKPRILFLYQWNRLVRMVEMGAPREVIGPTYFGQNAGSWDGETLVVDVQALHDSAALDKSGLPHGENAHLTQRFKAVGDRQMEVTIHVDDPEVYTRPWDAKILFVRQPEGTRIKEDICLEREGLLGKI
ncbi:hypothetical protein [Sphingobium sp.]|uniref:hypothetical protein n=1 Tax=Sphingobium sp. TaxID=1912891 RepID=UPI0028BD9999|nr:hypothetical protein [Sphingobium sp.]